MGTNNPREINRSRPLTQKQRERQERAEVMERKKQHKRTVRLVIIAIVALLVCACIALAVAFCVFRWQTYDDVADFQGKWRILGSDSTIEITEDKVCFTEDVAYTYVVDPEAKTMLFKFGNMTGTARYRFSLDRDRLSIEDGKVESIPAFFEDAFWTLQSIISEWMNSSVVSPATSKDAVVFIRVGSDDDIASSSSEGDGQGSSGSLSDGNTESGNGSAENVADDSDVAGNSNSSASQEGSSGEDSTEDSAGNTNVPDQLKLPVKDI